MPSATCWRSTSSPARGCPSTTPAMDSTTSRPCSRRRRRCSNGTCRRRAGQPAGGRRPQAEARRRDLRGETRSVQRHAQRAAERRSALRFPRRHLVRHYFPVDAEYVFKVRFRGCQAATKRKRPDPTSSALPVKAGLRTVGVTFPRENAKAESEGPGARGGGAAFRPRPDSLSGRPAPGRRARQAIRRARRHAGIQQLIIGGPYNPTGRGDNGEPREDFHLPPEKRQGRARPARRTFSRRSRAARSAGRLPLPTCSRFYGVLAEARSTRANG